MALNGIILHAFILRKYIIYSQKKEEGCIFLITHQNTFFNKLHTIQYIKKYRNNEVNNVYRSKTNKSVQ